MKTAILALGLLAAVGAASLHAEPVATDPLAGKRVLLLYSYHPAFASSGRILDGIRSVLDRRGVKLDLEYMDSKRFPSATDIGLFRARLVHKLAQLPRYDAIITSDDNALDFARAEQHGLFAGTPIVFLGVNDVGKAIAMDANPQITGVIEAVSLIDTIALARSLQHPLREVVAVVDDTPSGRADLANLRRVVPRFPGLRFTTISMRGLSWKELGERLARIEGRKIVLALALFRDRNGVVLNKQQAVGLLVNHAPVPVYTLRETDVRAGAFGGKVVDFDEQGRQAALIVERVLEGAPIASIRVVRRSPNHYMFNYAALQRFHVPLADLPGGSIVLGRPTSLLERDFGLVVLACAIIAGLIALVVWLAWQIAARRRVERELRDSEQRFRDMVEGSIQGVLIHRDRIPIFANQAFADMLGFESPEEILALESIVQIHAPHERERMRGYQAARRQGHAAPSQYEFDAVRKDGSLVTLLTVVRATTWNGAFATQHNAIDISARRRAEEAARTSEIRFRDFAETAADWFWETGPDHRFTFLSSRYLDVTGVAPESVIGLTRGDIYAMDLNGEEKWAQHLADLEAHRPFRDFEYRWRLPDGTVRVQRVSGKPDYDQHGGFLGYRGTGLDVTEAHALSEQLSYQATHDALTGLLNRRAFEQILQRAVERTQGDRSCNAVCYVDLDMLKVINDTCGHMAGDELLRRLGELLPEHVRKSDTIARLGGDEFGILMEQCSLEKAEEVAEGIRRAFEDMRFQWQEHRFQVGVSIGLVPATDTSGSVADILSAADSACYAAKEGGRNRVHVDRGDDREQSRRYVQSRWVSRLQHAIEHDLFRLYYQSIVPVHAERDERLHYELLLRLDDDDGPLVLPGSFMPAAERYNLSPRIDRWVVRTALRWLTGHPAHLAQLRLCSINLSGLSLGDVEFLEFVLGTFRATRVPPEKICFEITETAAIANLTHASRFITALKEHGCRIALDDFGSGLSSFGYLKNLPADFLKIDGMFVKDIADDPLDFAMVRSINEISRVMGKHTIAEFVEEARVLERLREIGVDFAQGYAIGPPLPLEDLALEHRAVQAS